MHRIIQLTLLKSIYKNTSNYSYLSILFPPRADSMCTRGCTVQDKTESCLFKQKLIRHIFISAVKF